MLSPVPIPSKGNVVLGSVTPACGPCRGSQQRGPRSHSVIPALSRIPVPGTVPHPEGRLGGAPFPGLVGELLDDAILNHPSTLGWARQRHYHGQGVEFPAEWVERQPQRFESANWGRSRIGSRAGRSNSTPPRGSKRARMASARLASAEDARSDVILEVSLVSCSIPPSSAAQCARRCSLMLNADLCWPN